MRFLSGGLALRAGFGCLIAAFVATAALAGETPPTYGVKGGYWFPGERLFREVLGSGPSAGAVYSLPLRPDRWIDFEILYWRGSGDLDPRVDPDGATTTASSDVTLVPLALSLRADSSPIRGIQPFIFGGIDLNVVKEEVAFVLREPGQSPTGGTNSISNAFLGLHVGGGAQYEVGRRTVIHLEARLSIVNADTEGVGGVLGRGVSLGGTGIFAGLRIR